MRGKRPRAIPRAVRTGITPAGAGKTFRLCPYTNRCRDHPRRCGENMFVRSRPQGELGSPPQVRGKPALTNSNAFMKRITPAGAGKTSHIAFYVGKTQDHPRRCGENRVPLAEIDIQRGSPPQVRGKRNPTYEDFGEDRITPAGAGKTLKRSFRNQPFCSRAVQISFNFSNSLNVSLQSGSAR